MERFRTFFRAHPGGLRRTCREGHLTASAWVSSPDGGRTLLVHHRRLGRWLQPGGHADGDGDTLRVALREVREETGLRELGAVEQVPLDLDIHPIPARGGEPAHLHFDVRWLLVADPRRPPRPSEESLAVRWVDVDDLRRLTSEESVLRLARRARRILG